MVFREIAFGTDDYSLARALRVKVLREPLGLSLHDDDLHPERQQLHFGAFEPDGSLVACVIAVSVSAVEAKIRQMAVTPARQGEGIGRRMMRELEKHLQSRGVSQVVLNARVSAIEFYEKQGYSVVSEEFVEVTIPHVRMAKTMLPHPLGLPE